jgi:uncharacterized membrane protein YuzA (DUF378 family)
MKIQAIISLISAVLVIAGAINWLAIGLYDKDLVEHITPDHAKKVYIAVGVAGIHQAVKLVMSKMA